MGKKSVVGPVLLVGGLAVGVIWALTGKKLQNLQAAFKSFSKDVKFSFPYLKVPVNVEITNPNKNPLTFQELQADVIINGSKVSELIYRNEIILPAKTTSTIWKIMVQTKVFSALDKALDTFNKTLTIRVKGYLIADKLKFPVDSTINING